MKYRVTHHFLTIDDDGNAVVETVEWTVGDFEDMRDVLHNELDNPGGRSGTTVALHIAALDAVTV